MSSSPVADVRRVLVTGAQGFIGHAVMRTFRSAGICCNSFDGRLSSLHQHSIEIDAVVHLAAVSRPTDFQGDLEAWSSNVTGTLDVINFCLSQGAGLILASTSGVYRHPTGPVSLDENAPLAPASDYAISKWLAETLVQRQAAQRGLAALILRVFNPYGTGQHPAFAVQSVATRLAAGASLFINNPDAVRDFIHVDDVAHAFLCAARALRPGECPVVNVGTGRGVTIMELARIGEKVFGPAVSLETNPDQIGQGGHVVADISLAEALLKWRPTIPLEEGLARMRQDMFSTLTMDHSSQS